MCVVSVCLQVFVMANQGMLLFTPICFVCVDPLPPDQQFKSC